MSGVEWVSRASQLASEVARIGGGPLALDSEADSFHHYREKVCLVQLSFGGRDVLVDPLAGLDLEPLRPVLADRSVRKILHGADYDLRVLHRDFGLEVRGLVDTMIAARLVGERTFGLSALLDKYLGVRLDKRYQRADWSQRPLSPEMEQYAVMDTRYLEPLARNLEERLAALGRSAWAEEEFRRMEDVRWGGDASSGEAYLRVKGLHRLDRREMGILRELHVLRDATARRRDVPPFRVMHDEVLLALSRSKPRSPSELTRIAGLPQQLTRNRGWGPLLEAVGRGLTMPESELPEPPGLPERLREPAVEVRVRRLRARRDRLAERLGLEPAVVAPRGVLEDVARRLMRGESLEATPDLRRWQADLLRPLVEGLE